MRRGFGWLGVALAASAWPCSHPPAEEHSKEASHSAAAGSVDEVHPQARRTTDDVIEKLEHAQTLPAVGENRNGRRLP